jgi:vacuolar-type H+-ATPase subunit E/Vma4
VLEARAAILEEARAAALLALDGVRATPDYPEVLKALVVEAALALAPADDLEVLIDERDEAVVSGDFLGSIEIVLTFSHNLATKLALANERIRTAGGVVVRGRGSRVRCDNTLEERLRAAWPDLSRRVAAEVYGEGAGG